jgi:hypothetical protein
MTGVTDNPAFTSPPDAGNYHIAAWEDLLASGRAGGDQDSLREVLRSEGLLHLGESEAASRLASALDADSDADIDPYPTTATAASHAFGPAGTGIPEDMDALQGAFPRPVPATDWTAGQYVTLGNGDSAHWDATEVTVTSGEADDETFAATAHGLSVDDPLIITAVTGGAGLSTNTLYYVATVPDANSFTLKDTAGDAVAFTTDASAITAYTGSWDDGVAE